MFLHESQVYGVHLVVTVRCTAYTVKCGRVIEMVDQAGGASRAPEGRAPLSQDRVLQTAVALADAAGIEALSMRHLAAELGVVPMALYKHVANKEQLLDGMVDRVVGEIDSPGHTAGWKSGIRERILSARRVLLRHPWATRVIESRPRPSVAVLDYLNSVVGMFLAGGFSIDLAHHVMHALGSRVWGFTQQLFPGSPLPDDPQVAAAAFRELAVRFPHIAQIAMGPGHDEGTIVGQGCDDQFEFEFALDLLLDGFERLRDRDWRSADARAQQH
jgi:AcrR family transcriptional regulator